MIPSKYQICGMILNYVFNLEFWLVTGFRVIGPYKIFWS